MVQSREGVRLRQSDRRRSGRFRPHGDGPELGSRGPSAGPKAVGANRGGQEGPHRGRTAFGLAGRVAAAVAIAATSACGSATAPPAPVERSSAGLEQVPLTIESSGKTHRFIVEVAETGEQQAQGLMFRKSLAPDRGMVFPRDPPGDASFWMKNTPMSLDPVPSLEPVGAVLEIAGGRSAELGIRAGDKVRWSR